MTELRECPFCGSPGRASDYDDHNGRMCYVVTCSNDDCLVSELVASGDTESEAVSRWNRRADPNVALQQENDTLRERLAAAELSASRWDFARQLVCAHDIEAWRDMLRGGHIASEAGNEWADAALDALRSQEPKP